MRYADLDAHDQLGRQPMRYSPPQPKEPLWLDGQGWFIALLILWNTYWPAFLIFQLVMRHR